MTALAALRDDLPVRVLRREAYRRMGNARGLRIFACPTTFATWAASLNKRTMVLLCAHHFMEGIDAYVDHDKQSSCDSRWHLDHVQCVLDALHNKVPVPKEEQPYDWWLLACVRLAQDIGRPAVLDMMRDSWDAYRIEAEASLCGIRIPSRATVSAARRSYVLVYATMYYVFGADYKVAVDLAERFAEPYFRLLALQGFEEGLKRCELKVSRETLEVGGVDTKALVSYAESGRLTDYPKFVTWRAAELRSIRRQWNEPGMGIDALKRLVEKTPRRFRYLLRINASQLALIVENLLS